jgi:hypothetical protein
MSMSKRAATALEKSIKHWDRLRDNQGSGYIGSEGCALCALYHRGHDWDKRKFRPCSNACPVKKVTGQDWCRGSPYRAAREAYTFATTRGAWLKAATNELDFLKSLRDS